MQEERILEEYLHKQIPLSAAMSVSVCAAGIDSVVLSAPIEPNINHKSTVFGGSASALAILSAWSLVHLRLTNEKHRCEIVIQSNHMQYERPMNGAFTATSSLVNDAAWPAFLKMLVRKKRARIEVQSALTCGDSIAGRFSGSFVAFLQDR